jgi:hypothetical protein
MQRQRMAPRSNPSLLLNYPQAKSETGQADVNDRSARLLIENICSRGAGSTELERCALEHSK